MLAGEVGITEEPACSTVGAGPGPETEMGALLRRNRLFLTNTLPFWVQINYCSNDSVDVPQLRNGVL